MNPLLRITLISLYVLCLGLPLAAQTTTNLVGDHHVTEDSANSEMGDLTVDGQLSLSGAAFIDGTLSIGTTEATTDWGGIMMYYFDHGANNSSTIGEISFYVPKADSIYKFYENYAAGTATTELKMILNENNQLILKAPNTITGLFNPEANTRIVLDPNDTNPQILINGNAVLTDAMPLELGNMTVSIGDSSSASGVMAVGIGFWSDASGSAATAVGPMSNAGGNSSAAFGFGANTSGERAAALGPNSNASGQDSTAIGAFSNSSGIGSVALSSGTASGTYSRAMGPGTQATKFGQFVIGQFNTYDPADDGTTRVDTDPVFVIGNGTGFLGGEQSDALTVNWNGDVWAAGDIKSSGNVLLGDGAMEVDNSVWGSVGISIAIGTNASVERDIFGTPSVSIGTNATSLSSGIAVGLNANAANNSVAIGTYTDASGSGAVAIGGVNSLYKVEALGSGSYALGYRSKAVGVVSATLGGDALESHAPYMTVVGGYNAYDVELDDSEQVWSSTNEIPVFVVGNGTPGIHPNHVRSNALYLRKNGDMDVAGAVRIWPQGDIPMLTGGGGAQPTTAEVTSP